MYSFQHNDKRDIAGLLDMVRRGCERFYKPCAEMRVERENESPKRYVKMTNNQKDSALLLAKTGLYNVTEIARQIGHTQSATFKFLVVKHKISTLRDGRATRNKKGAQ